MIWVLAALALAFLATVVAMLVNLGRMRHLADLPLPEREAWPTVSVVIPARNEALHLEAAMQRRMATDYPGLEVILVDDRSEDDTGAIADRLAAADPRITVIHNTGLPEGWLGKVHALDLGARRATGAWILFSDGDVEVAEGTVRRSVAFCEQGGFDLLAAIPRPDPAGPWVGTLHAVFARLLFGAAFVGAIEDPRRAWVIGVGAYTLVRREVLERSAGFAALRLDPADDTRLAQVVKHAGGRCTLVNGAGAVGVDFYPTVRDFLGGVEKTSWSTLAGFSLARGLGLSALFLAVELSPLLLALLAPTLGLRLAGAGILAAGAGASVYALAVGNGHPLPGLLYPVGSVLFALGIARGTVLGWWRGGLTWRGTFYDTATLKAAAKEAAAARRARAGAGSDAAPPAASPRSGPPPPPGCAPPRPPDRR